MNKEKLLEIIESTANFNAYIKDIDVDSLDGVTLDLIFLAREIDGDELSDEELLEVIRDITDHHAHYKSAGLAGSGK